MSQSPEHPAAETLQRYRQRTLAAAELLAVGDHLAGCESCRRQLQDAERLTAAVAAVGADLAAPASAEPSHLTHEQLAAYVDGGLDAFDREIADSHLESCTPCADRVRELRAFQALMTTQPAKEHAPAVRPGWGERLRSRLERFGSWLPVQAMGAAAAAAAAVFVIIAQPLHQEVDRQRATVRGLQSQVALLRGRPAPGGPALPPAGAPLALNDGAGELRLDPSGQVLRVEPLPEDVGAAVKQGSVEAPPPPALPAPPPGPRTRAWHPNPVLLQAPLQTAVLSDRPTFSWKPVPGATSYRVTLYDKARKPVLTSDPIKGTSWRVPPALARGRLYAWDVSALTGDAATAPLSPASRGSFQLLDAATADRVERARTRFRGSHLTLGVLYARAGLLDDAERELRQLVAANPNSPLARKLLASVRARRAGVP